MDHRLELHEVLCKIINITEPDGDHHVYFDPPESVRMKYPAIVYSRGGIDNLHADNSVYNQFYPYEVTVIDQNPDSEYVDKVSKLPRCKWNRHYKADNLNHDVFTLFN